MDMLSRLLLICCCQCIIDDYRLCSALAVSMCAVIKFAKGRHLVSNFVCYNCLMLCMHSIDSKSKQTPCAIHVL